MRALKRKLSEKKGFTLVEMLIVVAIIAILIAVSIPMMGSALERARRATDAANERAAQGLASILYLTGEITVVQDGSNNTSTNGAYLYDVANVTASLKSYASGLTGTSYGQCADHQGKCLWVRVLKDGTVQLCWTKKPSGTDGGLKWDNYADLCSSKLNPST